MKFELLEKETIYRGRAFHIRKDKVRLPDGRDRQLDVVEHQPAVTLVPLDDEGMLWFIHQYRHPAGQILLELPAGVVEPGEAPRDCAQRELREEIGMAARDMLKLGEFYLAPGYSSELMHVFLATGLYPAALEGDPDEFLRVEKIPVEAALHQAESGQILDAKTIGALMLARKHLPAD